MSLHLVMQFEWDPEKNRQNIAKHGIGFAEARRIFEGPTVTRPDLRFGYGEHRWISIGVVEPELVIAVVHTDRRGVTRLISARRANRKERRLYGEKV